MHWSALPTGVRRDSVCAVAEASGTVLEQWHTRRPRFGGEVEGAMRESPTMWHRFLTMWHRFFTGGVGGAVRFMLALTVAVGLVADSATVGADCADPPDPPDPLVLITELANDGTNTFVELHNPGAADDELIGWFLCHLFNYTPRGALDAVVVAAGETLVLQISGDELDSVHADVLIEWQVFGTDYSTGDMGLYDSDDFDEPGDIVDFLQWNGFGQGRETEADAACLWTAGDFIPPPLTGATLQLDGDAIDGGLTGSDDYEVHSFALNNLKVFPPPPPTATGDADGDEDVDLHDLAAFQDCNLGPEIPADTDTTDCTPFFDFDGDMDVDLVDFAAFQIVFTGPPLPVDMTIIGPTQVEENSTTGYSAMVTYSLGLPETLTVGVNWSVVPSTDATIDTAGMLMTLEVDGDQTATITAAFSFEGTPAVEDTLTITITDETEAPEPVEGTIALTELAGDGTNTYIELYNTGDFDISLTDWWLCLNPQFKYEEIAVESCDLIGGREVLVIQLGGTLDSSLADHAITISPAELDVGDIALYVGEDFSIFSNPDDIRDYLQWGAAGQNREDVGADAGLWHAGTYVDASLADGSVQLLEAAVDLPLTELDSLFVTPFSEHSLGVFPNPEPSSDDEPVEDDDSETPDEDEPATDDPDPDGELPEEDPTEPIGAQQGDDDTAEDPVSGSDDPEPPAEDEVPTTTGRPSSARSGLCGLFGMINLLTLITGLAMMKRIGHDVRFI